MDDRELAGGGGEFAGPAERDAEFTVRCDIFAIQGYSHSGKTRGLQRLYQSAYGLRAVGVRGTPWGLLWLVLIPIFLEVRALVAMVSHGLLATVLAVALGAIGWTVTPYILLGRAYSRTNQPAAAEAMLRRAIAYDPNNKSAHYLLAQILQQTGRADEAKREFAIAERLQGDVR